MFDIEFLKMCGSSTTSVHEWVMPAFLLLLLSHGIISATTPGNEDEQCGIFHYPNTTEVLLDTWRYRDPILPNEANNNSLVGVYI